MKYIWLVFAVATTGQKSPRSKSNKPGKQNKPGKPNKADQAATKRELRDEAVEWCDKWIEQSLTCKPPSSKVEKFQFRFKKVIDDAIWHYEGAKKCGTKKPVVVKYRKRRQSSLYYSEYYNEYSYGAYDEDYSEDVHGRYSEEPNVQALGAKCTLKLTDFFEHDDFTTCKKLGSWTRRANGLVGQVTTMMFLCLNDNMPTSDVYKQLSSSDSSGSPGYSPNAPE